jgi:NAD(P)-dependent dehydrogenase (short-subunit alcohol dehydrogenase family)
MSLGVLAGRTAVITGAGSGLGRGMAEHAGACGMRVVVADVEQLALDETVAHIREAGGEAIGVLTDVTDPDAVDALASVAYDTFGAVHLLHNNAGVFQGGLTWQRTLADWQWVMNVNFWAVLHGIRAFVPRLLAQEQTGDGDIHVVNTSSLAGLNTVALSSPYVVSKFACAALTECLAHDLQQQGSSIGVSCLVPGLVASRIGTSARNRPHGLGGEADGPDHVAANERFAAAADLRGALPSEAAREAFVGIQRNVFWITTSHLSADTSQRANHYDEVVRPRCEAILEHRLPGGQQVK